VAIDPPVIYGPTPCNDCGCCEDVRYFTDIDCTNGYMRCARCGCTQRIPDEARIESTQVTIRIYHSGARTVGSLRTFQELADVLGATSDALVKQDGTGFYAEIPTEGIAARMEIAKLVTPRS
jgi:flavoprotein